MAEGPRLADLWDIERKVLKLFKAWTALRQHSLEHNVMLEAWMAAAGNFAKTLNEKADRKETLGSWRDMLALWVETANTALLETQRSDALSQEPARNPQGEHRPAPRAAGAGGLLQRDVWLSDAGRARRRAPHCDRAAARAARAPARWPRAPPTNEVQKPIAAMSSAEREHVTK